MAFGAGLSSGLDRAQQNQQLRLKQQQLDEQKRQALSQEIDQRVKDTADWMSKAGENAAKAIYSSSSPEQRAEMAMKYNQQMAQLAEYSLETLGRTAQQAGLKSVDEVNRIGQIFQIASRLPSVESVMKVKEGEATAESRGKVVGSAQGANTPEAIEAQRRATDEEIRQGTALAREQGNQQRLTKGYPSYKDLHPDDPMAEGFKAALGKKQLDTYNAALAATDGIDNDKRAMALLDEGIITGPTADIRTTLAAALYEMGLIDSPSAANSQAYMQNRAIETVKLLSSGVVGAGTGISDKDVEWLKTQTGENIKYTEDALRRIVYLGELAKRSAIIESNKNTSSFDPKYRVEMPPMSQTFGNMLIDKIEKGGDDISGAEKVLYSIIVEQARGR